jgi:hypothetical protein
MRRGGVFYPCFLFWFFLSSTSAAEAPRVPWRTNYRRAYAAAKREGKLLLVYFYRDGKDSACERFEREALADPGVRKKLQKYVCVKTPVDEKIGDSMEVKEKPKGDSRIFADHASMVPEKSGQSPTRRIDHEAFREMLGRPGIAIVDFRSKDPTIAGRVVSEFPLTEKLWYSPEKMRVILELPQGTLTQRTIIFAVRTHPDRPASADGKPDPYLLKEAADQAQYQARICVQGHQRWGQRFARIGARLRGCAPREVCAESWPDENLVEAAVECVRCWRLSSGHWSAVRSRHRRFGYDMKRGRNGVWYATGIVGGCRGE